MGPSRIIGVAVVAMLIICSESMAAEFATDAPDGWHTWQIDEAGAVSEMCCFTRQRGSTSQSGCNLDGRRVSYGDGGNCSATTGIVQFYVLMKNGKPSTIRILSSECPVTTETRITDHGVITAKDNVEWFRNVIEDASVGRSVREEALFGLAQSESDSAFDYLDRLLTGR